MKQSTIQAFEHECERVRKALAFEKKEQEAIQMSILLQIQAHIRYVDQQRQLKVDEQDLVEAMKDNTDQQQQEEITLDLLGDVNTEDMTTLLLQERNETATTMNSTTTMTTTTMDSLIEMPLELLQPPVNMNTTVVPSGMIETLGDDIQVKQLMEELQVFQQDLEADLATAEQKASEETDSSSSESESSCVTTDSSSEELDNNNNKNKRPSVPINNKKKTIGGLLSDSPPRKNALVSLRKKREEEKQKRMRERVQELVPSFKDPSDKQEHPVDPVDPVDPVGKEMYSWVSGDRDPEYIKQNEGKRKRKVPCRYGTVTDEELKYSRMYEQMLRNENGMEGDGDSDDDDNGSDSSSASEEFVPTQSRIVMVGSTTGTAAGGATHVIEIDDDDDEDDGEEEFFADDYLNDEARKNRPRRRLRRAPTKGKGKKKSATKAATSSPKRPRTIVRKRSSAPTATAPSTNGTATQARPLPRPRVQDSQTGPKKDRVIVSSSSSEEDEDQAMPASLVEEDSHRPANASSSSSYSSSSSSSSSSSDSESDSSSSSSEKEEESKKTKDKVVQEDVMNTFASIVSASELIAAKEQGRESKEVPVAIDQEPVADKKTPSESQQMEIDTSLDVAVGLNESEEDKNEQEPSSIESEKTGGVEIDHRKMADILMNIANSPSGKPTATTQTLSKAMQEAAPLYDDAKSNQSEESEEMTPVNKDTFALVQSSTTEVTEKTQADEKEPASIAKEKKPTEDDAMEVDDEPPTPPLLRSPEDDEPATPPLLRSPEDDDEKDAKCPPTTPFPQSEAEDMESHTKETPVVDTKDDEDIEAEEDPPTPTFPQSPQSEADDMESDRKDTPVEAALEQEEEDLSEAETVDLDTVPEEEDDDEIVLMPDDHEPEEEKEEQEEEVIDPPTTEKADAKETKPKAEEVLEAKPLKEGTKQEAKSKQEKTEEMDDTVEEFFPEEEKKLRRAQSKAQASTPKTSLNGQKILRVHSPIKIRKSSKEIKRLQEKNLLPFTSEDAKAQAKTSTTASNGLIPRKRPEIETTTVLKGKFEHKRRAIKLLGDDNQVVEEQGRKEPNQLARPSRYAAPAPAPLQDPLVTPLEVGELAEKVTKKNVARRNGHQRFKRGQKGMAIFEEERIIQSSTETNVRYLTASSDNTKQKKKKEGGIVPTYTSSSVYARSVHNAAEQIAIHAGKRKLTEEAEPKSKTKKIKLMPEDPVEQEEVTVNKVKEYPREPQIDLYTALGIDDKAEEERANLLKDTKEHKRPRKFERLKEEAIKNGRPLIKSMPKPQDLDKLPIPKKAALKGSKPSRYGPSVAETAGDVQYKQSLLSTIQPVSSSILAAATLDKSKPLTVGELGGRKDDGGYGRGREWDRDRDRDRDHDHRRRGRYHGNGNRRYSRPRSRSLSPSERDHRNRGYLKGIPISERREQKNRSRGKSHRRRSRSFSSSSCSSISSSSSSSDGENGRKHRRKSSKKKKKKRSSRYSPSRTQSRSRSRSTSPKKSKKHKRRRSTSSSNEGEDKNPNMQHAPLKTEFEGFSMLDSVTSSVAHFDPDMEENSVFLSESDEEKPIVKKQAVVLPGGRKEEPKEQGQVQPEEEKDKWQLVLDLSSFDNCIDQEQMAKSIYVTGLTHMMTEEVIEKHFESFGLAMNEETGFPHVDVFFCQRTHRPRGDARLVFTSHEAAARAVEDMHHKTVSSTRLSVRKMDLFIAKVLYAQFDTVKTEWKCSNVLECGQLISMWQYVCPCCFSKRVFSPSAVAIQPNDWLCSICYTANRERSTSCQGCFNKLKPFQNRMDTYK